MDKAKAGATAGALSSAAIVGLCHLALADGVPLSILMAAVCASSCSGSLASIEGTIEEKGFGFGAVCGLFFGSLGGYYAKGAAGIW